MEGNIDGVNSGDNCNGGGDVEVNIDDIDGDSSGDNSNGY